MNLYKLVYILIILISNQAFTHARLLYNITDVIDELSPDLTGFYETDESDNVNFLDTDSNADQLVSTTWLLCASLILLLVYGKNGY